jgi:hypothetical protein
MEKTVEKYLELQEKLSELKLEQKELKAKIKEIELEVTKHMTDNDQVLLELKNGSFELSKLKFKPKVEKPKKEPKEKVEKVEKPKKEKVKENKSELSFVNKTKTVADIEKENKKKKK